MSGTGLSGVTALRSARTCGHDSRRFRTRSSDAQTTASDTDSHGVSDPPDTRGAISNARTGVAHAMFPALNAAPVPAHWAAKTAARRAGVVRSRCNLRRENRLWTVLPEVVALVVEVGVLALSAIEGTTSISEVVPKVVLSGDVNQGGEMQVLSREVDALNTSESAVDGVGHDRRTGHP